MSCEYANAVRDSVPEIDRGDVAFVSPLLSSALPEKIVASEADRAALFESLAALAPEAEPLGREEFDAALHRALVAQRRFERTVERGNERAMAWAHERGRHGILLAGRPYHADPAVLHGIDGVLEGLGFSVAAAEVLSLPCGDGGRSRKGDLSQGDRLSRSSEPLLLGDEPRGGTSAPGKSPWRASKHLAKLAQVAIDDPVLDLVCLQSFNCLYDSLSISDVRDVLRAAGRPFTALKIDDIADTAHLRIRLRTLAETIERTQSRAIMGRRSGFSDGEPVSAKGSAGRPVRVAAPAPAKAVAAARAGSPSAFDALDQADVETARMHVNDVCFVVSAYAGRAIRLVAAAPDLERLAVFHVCESCLLDGLGRIVERACGTAPEIVWEPLRRSDGGRSSHVDLACGKAQGGELPIIGLVGTAPLVFDSFMNDGLPAFIGEHGCRVALPDAALLETDDIRYLPQLDAFAHGGVDHVIHLVSFGCLKGHVSARGALRFLARRYPDMPVTVIDYDPEASALNRENRVRLAIEAARRIRAERRTL